MVVDLQYVTSNAYVICPNICLNRHLDAGQRLLTPAGGFRADCPGIGHLGQSAPLQVDRAPGISESGNGLRVNRFGGDVATEELVDLVQVATQARTFRRMIRWRWRRDWRRAGRWERRSLKDEEAFDFEALEHCGTFSAFLGGERGHSASIGGSEERHGDKVTGERGKARGKGRRAGRTIRRSRGFRHGIEVAELVIGMNGRLNYTDAGSAQAELKMKTDQAQLAQAEPA